MDIKRDKYLNDLINRMHNGMIKVVTGIRRCGKSYLLFNIFKNYLLEHGVTASHIITIELDQRKNKKYRDPDTILDYIESLIEDDEQYYIMLDEVQMLQEFEEVLNSLLHIRNADIYVTGSNSKFLSNYICCSTYGKPRSKDFHWKYFKQLLQENDLPDIRWHDLRATYCTILLKNDFNPKAVSKLMGHAKEIITIDVYGDKQEIIEDCLEALEPFIDQKRI